MQLLDAQSSLYSSGSRGSIKFEFLLVTRVIYLSFTTNLVEVANIKTQTLCYIIIFARVRCILLLPHSTLQDLFTRAFNGKIFRVAITYWLRGNFYLSVRCSFGLNSSVIRYLLVWILYHRVDSHPVVRL